MRLKRNRRRKRTWRKSCDIRNCDVPPTCDCGFFYTLLMLGSTTAGALRSPVVDRAGQAAILGYRRWVSHRWPGQCRFTPTCGAYGLAAVERYGLAVGGRMSADRVRRCRPHVPLGTRDPVN